VQALFWYENLPCLPSEQRIWAKKNKNNNVRVAKKASENEKQTHGTHRIRKGMVTCSFKLWCISTINPHCNLGNCWHFKGLFWGVSFLFCASLAFDASRSRAFERFVSAVALPEFAIFASWESRESPGKLTLFFGFDSCSLLPTSSCCVREAVTAVDDCCCCCCCS